MYKFTRNIPPLKSGVWLLAAIALMSAEVAQAYTHQYINQSRSSISRHIFVTQGIDMEYGMYKFKNGSQYQDRTWQGYGIQNSVGMELMKFIQFSAGHTLIQNRAVSNGQERLSGTRLNGDLKLIFSAPVGNLEAGAGVVASRVDYHSDRGQAGLYGSGMNFSLGMNYYLSSNVSFYGKVRQLRENLVHNSGSAEMDNIYTDSRSMGFGVSIWL